jgi:hypothetical protein
MGYRRVGEPTSVRKFRVAPCARYMGLSADCRLALAQVVAAAAVRCFWSTMGPVAVIGVARPAATTTRELPPPYPPRPQPVREFRIAYCLASIARGGRVVATRLIGNAIPPALMRTRCFYNRVSNSFYPIPHAIPSPPHCQSHYQSHCQSHSIPLTTPSHPTAKLPTPLPPGGRSSANPLPNNGVL